MKAFRPFSSLNEGLRSLQLLKESEVLVSQKISLNGGLHSINLAQMKNFNPFQLTQENACKPLNLAQMTPRNPLCQMKASNPFH